MIPLILLKVKTNPDKALGKTRDKNLREVIPKIEQNDEIRARFRDNLIIITITII